MLAVIVNTLTVIIGSAIGLLLKKGIPDRITDTLMKGIALCTLYIGWSGTLKGQNTLVLIISMAIGVVIGEGLDLDDKLNRLGKWLENKFKSIKSFCYIGGKQIQKRRRKNFSGGRLCHSIPAVLCRGNDHRWFFAGRSVRRL